MARIELRNCTVRVKDGLSGTGAVNQPSTAPTVTDTSLTIDTLVLNTADTAKVPVGARFHIAGETTQVDHVVTARTQGAGTGTNAKQNVVLADCSTTFTLSWGGKTTAAIAYDGDAAAVKAALVAMDDGYTTDDWAVTGTNPNFVVEFKGALGDAPRALMTGTGDTGSVTVTNNVVGAVPVPTTTTIAITFSPALGAGSYADGGVLTFRPQQIDIKIGDGEIKYTEANNYNYDKDRGELDTVREGDDVPMDVSMNFTFEHVKTGTSEAISPIDAIKGINGAAEWVSSSSDLCEPYAVDVEVEHVPPCGTAQKETTLFPDFRSEKRDFDFKNAAIAVSGKCNATEPIVTRG
jgi:hypothetical protein